MYLLESSMNDDELFAKLPVWKNVWIVGLQFFQEEQKYLTKLMKGG